MPSGGPGRFSVDPKALHELARSMVVLGAYLDGARAYTEEATVATFGDRSLADAAKTFVEHWEWLAKKISEHLSDTATRVTTVAANYQQVEDAQKAAEGIA